mmetsp:Transcript_34576/g.98093  ORF Transcript_34576/g.98093 Transcript_34576/m.98093 type:complete len:353 (+) Transcript_34576:1-1059(+)
MAPALCQRLLALFGAVSLAHAKRNVTMFDALDSISERTAPQYDEKLSLFFALLAQVAFCDPENIERWDCGEPCEKTGFKPRRVQVLHPGPLLAVQGFVALVPEELTLLPQTGRTRCIVSFRGSNNMKNWMADAMAWLSEYHGAEERAWCLGCKVHEGFETAYSELRTHLWGAVLGPFQCKEVYVTGHSLGAAVATMAVSDLRGSSEIREMGIKVPPAWLFGAPAVGEAKFVETLMKNTLPEEAPGAWRLVNEYDIVPRLGRPVYHHYGPEIFINEEDLSYTYCPKPNDLRCMDSVGHVSLLWNQKASNHVSYMNVNFASKHLPGECRSANAAPEPQTDSYSEEDLIFSDTSR